MPEETAITEEMWNAAINHARLFYKEYLLLGSVGVFGAITISTVIQRYESGERTNYLYNDLIEIE